MLKFKIKTTAGFSVLEALTAVAILILGILTIIKIFPLALMTGAAAKQTTIAANLAQAKAEELVYLDYGNISVGAIEAKHRLALDPNDSLYQYQRETTIAYLDSNLNPTGIDTGLKKIMITVFWNSAVSRSEKTFNLETLISQK